jgi:DNA-binding phage protein
MGNKKISKKPKRKSQKSFPAFEVSDAQIDKLLARSKEHDPNEMLAEPEFIAHALAECLLEDDEASFKEILKAHYESLNISLAFKKSKLSKSTILERNNRKKKSTFFRGTYSKTKRVS